MKNYYVITFDHTGGKDFLEDMIEIILKLGGNNLTYVTKTTINFWTSIAIFKNLNKALSKETDLNYFICRIQKDDNGTPICSSTNKNTSDIKSFNVKVKKIKEKMNSK